MNLFNLLTHIAPAPGDAARLNLDFDSMVMAERRFIAAVVRERLGQAESGLRPQTG